MRYPESTDAQAACKQAYTSRSAAVTTPSSNSAYHNTIIWENLNLHGSDYIPAEDRAATTFRRTGDGRAVGVPVAQGAVGWGGGRTVYNAGMDPTVATRNNVQGHMVPRQDASPSLTAFDRVGEEEQQVSDDLYALLMARHERQQREFRALHEGKREEVDCSEGDEMFQQFINAEECADYGHY